MDHPLTSLKRLGIKTSPSAPFIISWVSHRPDIPPRLKQTHRLASYERLVGNTIVVDISQIEEEEEDEEDRMSSRKRKTDEEKEKEKEEKRKTKQ